MPRWAIGMAVAMLLVGCADPVSDTERQVDLVRRHGDASERCQAERRLAQAYLEARRERQYAEQDVRADVACMNAQLSGPHAP